MVAVPTFLLLATLLLCSAFFSSSEAALFGLSKVKRRALERRNEASARLVLDLLRQPKRVLVTILVGNTTVNVAISAVGTSFGLLLAGGESGLPFVIAGVTATVVVWGELLPKVLAVRMGERLSLRIAPWLDLVHRLLEPLGSRLEGMADTVLRRVPIHQQAADSGRDLSTLLRIGEEGGVLASREVELLDAILALRETEVGEIMTPRVEIEAVRWEPTDPGFLERVRHARRRVLPVYGRDLDDLTGVLLARRLLLAGPGVDPASFVVEPLCIPETRKAVDLLDDFRKSGQHFAIVVDEHGGTSGLVSLEDILEEIFGTTFREGDESGLDVRREGPGFRVAGRATLAALEAEAGFRFDSPDQTGATTVAGLLMERLGRLPRRGDLVEIQGFRFLVTHLAKRRVLAVELTPPSAGSPAEGAP